MSTPAAEPAKTPDLNREEVAAEAYKLSVSRAQRGATPDAVGDWFEAEAIVRARMEEKRQAHAAAAARVLTAPIPESARPVTAAGKAAAKKAVEAKAAAKAKPAPAPTKSSGKNSGKKK
jgi:hypothetical protein